MHPIDRLFQALGGVTAVADVLGVGQSTASEMRRRKSIPVRYWPALLDAWKVREPDSASYEALVSMHSRERDSRSPAPQAVA